LVDDEWIIMENWKLMLEGRGNSVDGFSDPVQALDLFKSQPEKYDILITDLSMQPIDGLALIQKVLTVRGDIPVILITGHNDKIGASDQENYGIKKILGKPINERILVGAVREVLDEGQNH